MTTTLEEPREATPSRSPRRSPAAGLLRLLKSRETGVALVLILIVAITTLKNPAFLVSGDGFRDLLVTPSILLVVVLGQAVVIITRNVDLSVGSVLGLTAYFVGTLFVSFPAIPVPLMFLIGCAFGAALGILLSFNYFGVTVSAFVFGVGAVALAWCISRASRMNGTLAMVLAGIVVGSLLWGVIFDGFRPDRADVLGAAICLVGVGVIMYGR